ncbi:MAG TPA: DUF1684 domain-containing protein [Ktedonobacterales bacterium]
MTTPAENPPTWLDLYDYRRRVAALYQKRELRETTGDDPAAIWDRWREERDWLFKEHPQSALSAEDRATFTTLRYFPYDHALRIEATLAPQPAQGTEELPSSGPHPVQYPRAGTISFTLDGAPMLLAVYWIDVYGGGLFLPFRDATSGTETYGAGRYLFDTVKGSDFLRLDGDVNPAPGYAGGRVLLDFNYAYNPSCSYDLRWACPLAPRENTLPVAIRAGEQVYHE